MFCGTLKTLETTCFDSKCHERQKIISCTLLQDLLTKVLLFEVILRKRISLAVDSTDTGPSHGGYAYTVELAKFPAAAVFQMLAPGFPAASHRLSSVFNVPTFLRFSLVLRSRSALENILTLEFGDRDFRPGEKNVSRSSECDVRVNHSAE
jgi:hypothetical protein